MKSTTKRMSMMLSLIILVSSCALYAKVLVPKLELRTLRINKDLDGFKYTYCKKRTFFRNKCKDGSWTTDVYKFADTNTMLKLKSMGFVLRVDRKPID